MSDIDYTLKLNKNNISNKKLVCGVGINDADYQVQQKFKDKIITCPFYRKWQSMLNRCYSASVHKKRPTYIGCSVSSEWLLFSNFKKWMEKQNWENNDLDKDLLLLNNKVYSADTCLFIPPKINTLLLSNNACRGKFPQGVSLNKQVGRADKYKAQISINNKKIHIGLFFTIEEARTAYLKVKIAYIESVALEQDTILRTALTEWCQRNKEKL